MSDTVVVDAYHRALPLVGEELTVAVGEVSALAADRFAVAADDHAPREQVDEGSSGEPIPAAPPLFLTSVMDWSPGPAEADLLPDGTSDAMTAGLRLDGVRLMGAGQELEFHRAVLPGMRLIQHVTVADISLKEGRSGALLLITLDRHYRDRDGVLVTSCRETFIGR